MKDKEDAPETILASMYANGLTMVPKYCTSVTFQATQDQKVIMSLIYSEGSPPQNALIERVVMDIGHAQKFNKVLGEMLGKLEDDKQI